MKLQVSNFFSFILKFDKDAYWFLGEIEKQEILLRHQRKKKDKIIRTIISDQKTPFVARYTLYQQQLASKQREVTDLKLQVFSELLTYCKEFLEPQPEQE